MTGKLLYIHHCVKQARQFLNGILATLCKTPLSGHIQLPTDFYKDINWFNLFLDTFNALVEIHQVNKVPLQVYVDVSLRMVGGYFQGKVYAVEVPLAILNVASIVHLEAANILVAFKTCCIYLFIWGFTSYSTLYRSYHDG